MTTATIIAIIGVILTILNIIDKVITLKKNADAPFKELENRVIYLESKQKENEDRFKQGNDQFKRIYEFTRVFIQVNLAFIDFETAFCKHTNYTDTKDLEIARKTLQDSLADLKTQF